MNDLLRNFAHRAQFRVQQHIGLFVKRGARGEQFADFCLRVRVVQQRAVRLVFDALPDFFGRSPKADDQRARFQAGEIFWIRRQTATSGNDRFPTARKFGDNFFFECPEIFFTIVFENLGDGFAGGCLNHFVRVKIFKIQQLGDKAANGSLARAHETNERKIDDAAIALHESELTQFCLSRTPQIFRFWTFFNPRLSLPRENAAAYSRLRVASAC